MGFDPRCRVAPLLGPPPRPGRYGVVLSPSMLERRVRPALSEGRFRPFRVWLWISLVVVLGMFGVAPLGQFSTLEIDLIFLGTAAGTIAFIAVRPPYFEDQTT